ncbi:MAG: hypothetical protein J1G30_03910 [Spirochaetales bacterium]|nr:hypothetical protein [Spirochaetales bacterium]
MAMKDVKSVKVHPSERDEVKTRYLSFGWEYKDSQEVKTNDSQIFTGRDDKYEYYETQKGVHYVMLNFERDRSRPNYNELKSLEEQYDAIEDPYCPDAPRFITILWVILIGVGFVAYVIPGIILLVLHIIFHIKKSKAYNEDYASYTRKCAEISTQREEILTKAQALV